MSEDQKKHSILNLQYKISGLSEVQIKQDSEFSHLVHVGEFYDFQSSTHL